MCTKVLTLKGPPAICSRHCFFSLSLLNLGIKIGLDIEIIKPIFLKIKKLDVAKFIVCSSCDWSFKG